MVVCRRDTALKLMGIVKMTWNILQLFSENINDSVEGTAFSFSHIHGRKTPTSACSVSTVQGIKNVKT